MKGGRMEVNLKENARYVQERYGVKLVFVTEDGQAFLENTYARMHAERKGLGLSSFDGSLEETEIIPRKKKADADENNPVPQEKPSVPQEPAGVKEQVVPTPAENKETPKTETT